MMTQKIINYIKNYGIIALIKKSIRMIYFINSHTIWYRDLNELIVPLPKNNTYSVYKANKDEIDLIVSSWPRELGNKKSEELKNIITERFSNNIPCFVIKSITGDLLGAVWCKNYTYAIPNIKGMSPIKRNETFEINNIFISEAARGSGLSSLLLTYAMTSMKNDEDKNIVFSRIYQERKSSIIAHKRVGFIKYGILELGYKFGRKINAVIEDTKK